MQESTEEPPGPYDTGGSSHLVALRCSTAPYAGRLVHLSVSYRPDEVEYRVRDEGQGFDPEGFDARRALSDTERLHGRDGARAIGEIFRRTSVHPERFPEPVLAVYREAAARPGALTAMLNYYRALLRGGGGRRKHSVVGATTV